MAAVQKSYVTREAYSELDGPNPNLDHQEKRTFLSNRTKEKVFEFLNTRYGFWRQQLTTDQRHCLLENSAKQQLRNTRETQSLHYSSRKTIGSAKEKLKNFLPIASYILRVNARHKPTMQYRRFFRPQDVELSV